MGQNRFLSIILFLVLIAGFVTPVFAGASEGTLYMVSKGDDTAVVSTQLWILDTSTGVAIPRPNSVGFESCTSIDFHPDTGVLYAACESDEFFSDENGLILINPGTGIGTAIGGNENFGCNYGGMSFHPTTKLLYAHTRCDGIGTMNLDNGDFTIIGGENDEGGNGLAFATDSTLYIVRANNDKTDPDTINTVDISDGGETASADISYESPLADEDKTTAMDFSPNTGTLWAAIKQAGVSDADTYLATLNPTTGAMGTPLLIKDVTGVAIVGVDGIAFLSHGVTVGGVLFPIDSTVLLLAGTQMTASWLVPVIVAGAGIGLVLVRKSKNS